VPMPTFETDKSGFMWDSTAVPNAFFCEYMPIAPESHVMVYLYGLMWVHSGLMTDDDDPLEEIARTFHLERADVDRAMRYWERCHLVERVQDQPPRYRFLSLQQTMMQRQYMPQDTEYEAFAQAVYAAFGDRRKLHGGETVLAYEWVEQLKLPQDVVLMLLQHMISTHGVNFSFKTAQKVAGELHDQQINTIEAAEAVFERSIAAMEGARIILNHLGIRRNPSLDEADLYIKWTKEWGFEPKAIREACRETTKGAPTFAYLDAILEGIHSRSDGKARSAQQVEKALLAEQAETAQIREVLNALGISMPVIDEGLRAEYRDMAQTGGHDLVMLATREVVRHSKVHTLDRVTQLLSAWVEKGYTTVASVGAYLGEVEMLNQQLRSLMEIAGSQGGCTAANRDHLKQWQSEWRMPQEVINLAAELSRGTSRPVAYMHKLLSGWHESGILSPDEARAAHERHLAELKKAPDKPAAGSGKRVLEQQYEQRHYDPAEYDDIPEDQLEEMKRL